MTIKVEVTERDIVHGRTCDCKMCPVAIALHRLTGRVWHVSAEMAYEMGKGRRFRNPSEVSQWIRQFDLGQAMKPFTFEALIVEGGRDGYLEPDWDKEKNAEIAKELEKMNPEVARG